MFRARNWPWQLAALSLALFVIAFAGSPVIADTGKPLKGVALIVGQSKYAHLPQLPNTGNDAQALSKLLGDLGFNVTTVTDQDTKRLRRAFENFAEDAEGSDVALIYYSGHGIEAGGENWLVPVDSDLTSLDDAGNRLVPLSGLLDGIRKAVPLTLLFLDACRTNPFPPGATLTHDGVAAPVSAAGLAAARGAAAITGEPVADGSLGSLIGFAAEPGQPALDGPAGGNSPYAAALLRHLSASSGAEFGAVMRMVTQEVYLKTNGRQRPWVNETLTKLLYFGGAGSDPEGGEGEILKERRGILLTVSALSGSERRQVEQAAASGGAPLDALYGLLNALGADAPKDPAELEKVLKAQTETIKAKQDKLASLDFDDAEIKRLTGLAEQAFADGALETNARFLDQAIARYEQVVRPKRDSAEAEIKASRLAGAALYASAARADELKFNFASAALKYAQAFAEVEKWDDGKALDYKLAQGNALYAQGDQKGDNAALRQAIDAYAEMLLLVRRSEDPLIWATAQNNLGAALLSLGDRETGTARLEEAVAAYRAALEEQTRERVPLDWAATQNNLGAALQSLGDRETGTARLEQAVAAYRAALEERTRDRVPLDWAMTQNNLGIALASLGQRETGAARLEQAVAAYRAALEEWTRDRVPLDWAQTQNNLGNALQSLGYRETGTARLEQAVAAYRAALEERTRDRVPLNWAMTQNNLGNALKSIGDRGTGTAHLEQAVAAYRAALEERTRERVPLNWARTQNNLGNALASLGQRETGTARLEQAVAAYRAALEERTRDRVPLDWAQTQNNLGNALTSLGQRNYALADRVAATEAWSKAAAVWTRQSFPKTWARLQNAIGYELVLVGELEQNNPARFEAAIPILRGALEVQRSLNASGAFYTADSLCRALLDLGRVKADRPMLLAAKDLCSNAVDGFAKLGALNLAEKARDHLTVIEEALAALP